MNQKNEARAAAIAARGEEFIEALKSERATLKQRGLTDRVKDVDAQIKIYGGDPKAAAVEPDVEPDDEDDEEAEPTPAAASGTPATTASTKPTTTR